jgi:sterol desaturase/sphingolipid hydroxylase (fatty acid hydroxylase superfamily)
MFLLFVTAEVIWSRVGQHGAYHLGESIANLSIAAVNGLIRPLSLAWKLVVFTWVEPLQAFTLPGTLWAFVLTFLVADLGYYGYHRLTHKLPVLWTMHHTHHSSRWMNLTTAVRLNWMANFVSPLFFAPLVILGLSPEMLTISLALGLLYQFFLHTRLVPQLGWFEGKLLNTPAAHRVHHGSNPQYLNRNYAGVLIIWDRLFGTYVPETDAVRYGVTGGDVGRNPLVIQLAPMWQYLRRTRRGAA